jgi:hypothetical protein
MLCHSSRLGASRSILVYTVCMKKITFSADRSLIERARATARSRGKTLSLAFREWREQFAAKAGSTNEYNSLTERLIHLEGGRGFSRDEMNQR